MGECKTRDQICLISDDYCDSKPILAFFQYCSRSVHYCEDRFQIPFHFSL